MDRDEASVLIDKEAELRAKYTPCGCCERGVVSMPRLRAALEALGREIKTNRVSVS